MLIAEACSELETQVQAVVDRSEKLKVVLGHAALRLQHPLCWPAPRWLARPRVTAKRVG